MPQRRIEIARVAKDFTVDDRPLRALDGIDLAVAPGEFVTIVGAKPVRTVGSFWPYATTLFDYVRRAMPFDAPQSLSDAEVSAVSAYLLHLNGIVPADAVLDAARLPAVAMPNRAGFVPDARPDVTAP